MHQIPVRSIPKNIHLFPLQDVYYSPPFPSPNHSFLGPNDLDPYVWTLSHTNIAGSSYATLSSYYLAFLNRPGYDHDLQEMIREQQGPGNWQQEEEENSVGLQTHDIIPHVRGRSMQIDIAGFSLICPSCHSRNSAAPQQIVEVDSDHDSRDSSIVELI